MSDVLEIVLVVVLILWNAYFVAAEYAFVSVRHTRLEELVGQGDRRARIVRRIVSDPSRFITAMQLGPHLRALGLRAAGEPAVSRMIEDAIGALPHWAAAIIAFALITIPS